jgi:hypothetical protein
MKIDKLTMGVELKSCKDCSRVEPLEGSWLPSEIDCEDFKCSVCGGAAWYYNRVQTSRYCPNCGAFMINFKEEIQNGRSKKL